jgi:hypothetical protein
MNAAGRIDAVLSIVAVLAMGETINVTIKRCGNVLGRQSRCDVSVGILFGNRCISTRIRPSEPPAGGRFPVVCGQFQRTVFLRTRSTVRRTVRRNRPRFCRNCRFLYFGGRFGLFAGREEDSRVQM